MALDRRASLDNLMASITPSTENCVVVVSFMGKSFSPSRHRAA
jgi:hypothetical protein